MEINLGIDLETRANFFYDAILDAILECSSNVSCSACILGRPSILVSTHVFVGKEYNESISNSEI